MAGFIEWFNGKKTVIGTICLWIAAFISQVLIPEWGIGGETMDSIVSTLNWFGIVFGGVGLTHKVVKRNSESAP